MSLTTGYLFAGVAAGTDEVGQWFEVFQNKENSSPLESSKHWYVTNLSMDYTFVNKDPSNTMELDIYEFVFRKDYTGHIQNIETEKGVSGELKEALLAEAKLPGATAQMAITDLGVVPTDCNAYMKYIIIKSKQRYYLGPGNAASFIKRTKFHRPIKIQSEDFEIVNSSDNTDLLLARAGLTRGIIAIYRGTPANSGADAVNLGWNAQARYQFKVIDPNLNSNAQGL